MLRPLQQWICDSCGDVINSPDQGYVEWQETDHGKNHGFRIVHHALYSPRRRDGRDCYYSNKDRAGDIPLSDCVGPRGLVELSSWIDLGVWHDSDYSGPSLLDLREWTIFFRRLHLPYYEEARLCTEELKDEVGGGSNEIHLYLPETLKRVIEQHESSQRQ